MPGKKPLSKEEQDFVTRDLGAYPLPAHIQNEYVAKAAAKKKLLGQTDDDEILRVLRGRFHDEYVPYKRSDMKRDLENYKRDKKVREGYNTDRMLGRGK